MKKTIYRYFFYEFLRYFTITLFALAVIVWSIQAVNYLDLVSEDGHAFTIYFSYSFLALSKVITKLMPFCFLVAAVLTISKLERDNELMVLWTSGLNKIHVANFLFTISLLIMFVQILFTTSINPKLLYMSRMLLKNSELQFIPSLLKEKKFNDTVEGLTIFVNKKGADNSFEDIFIRDDGQIISEVGGVSSTIFAKYGYISDSEKNLVLHEGSIQRLKKDGEISIFKFEKTILNLTGLTTKSISEPKMQETSTFKILLCLIQKNINIHNCNTDKKSLMDNKIEINKRFGMPFYIPLIALLCCFLLSSRRDKKIYNYKKYIYFFIGFIILAFSEIIVRYSGISWKHSAFYYLIPLLMSPFIYLILIRTFKYENLS